MNRSPILEFECSAFAAEAEEDAETNPGVFGRALASWLAGELRDAGVRTGATFAEDFGWCVPVEEQTHRLHVVCSNVEDETNHWRVFVFSEQGFLARVLRKDRSAAAVADVFARVEQIVTASPHVRALRRSQPSAQRGTGDSRIERR